MKFELIQNVLFDLDGTVTDSKPGIIKSIRYALEKMNVETPADIDWCLGPPLFDSFKILIPNASEYQVNQAVNLYRERYAVKGMFESELYAGIPELLEDLKAADFNIYLATSKPWKYAEKILTYFEVDKYFIKAFGSEMGGAFSDKKDLLAEVLKQIGSPAENCLMIGDRQHDLIGAAHNHIPAMGVLWGYGSREELSSQPHVGLLKTPSELSKILISEEKVANA